MKCCKIRRTPGAERSEEKCVLSLEGNRLGEQQKSYLGGTKAIHGRRTLESLCEHACSHLGVAQSPTRLKQLSSSGGSSNASLSHVVMEQRGKGCKEKKKN